MHEADEFFSLDLPDGVCESRSVSINVCHDATCNGNPAVPQKAASRLPVEAVVLDHVI